MRRGGGPGGAHARPYEEEGIDRGILWVEGGLGYSYADIGQLDYDQLLPMGVRLSGGGPAATLAAGVRLAILTLGVRGNFASYVGFDLGSVVLDAALRLPTPVIEPYFRVGFGYSWLGDADYDHPKKSETDVSGSTIEGGIGLDLYVESFLSIGVGFDFAILFMTREGVEVGCTTSCDPTSATIQKDGDSVGGQARLHAQAALHF